MELVVIGFVVILQFLYIVYSDIQNRKERDRLTLKIKAKDLEEYRLAVDEPQEDMEDEVDPYVDVEDVDSTELIYAKDKI